MENPFLTIDRRLENIELLLLDLKYQPLQQSESAPGKVMSLTECAKYTGLCEQTLYRKTSAGQIPHSKRAGRLFFDRAQVDAWLLEKEVPTKSDLSNKADAYLAKAKRSC